MKKKGADNLAFMKFYVKGILNDGEQEEGQIDTRGLMASPLFPL